MINGLSVLLTACALSAAADDAAPVAAAYTNAHAILAFDARGRIAYLKDRAGGDSFVKTAPVLSYVDAAGKTVTANALRTEGGRLRYAFDGGRGELEMSVRTEDWGFVFTVEKCTLAGASARTFNFQRIQATDAFRGGSGYVLSALSSETHTIVLRAYRLECASRAGGLTVGIHMPGTFDPVGQRFALILAKRADVIPCLKALTRDSGTFYTTCGGAWSLEAPENRRSYLFSHFSRETIDDWIDLAELGGFSTLHASGWWKALGHYTPNPAKFPRGEADLKECIDRAKAAGLTVSTHTLCSGIAFSDPWITPECNTNLLALYRYTLAEPLADDAKELVIAEKPGPNHDLVTAYFSRGNIFRIGTELITYTGFTKEPPYKFTGLKRGAYGTRKIGPVAKGTPVDYVFQRFMTLFPDPKTPFGTEMAQHLCGLCNRMGFSLVYQDGAEPFSAYDVALNRLNFAKYLDQSRGPVQIEASTWNNESWPFHSRIGAWDHPVWAMKRFHDLHLDAVLPQRRNNFISAQMGWWNPRLACDYAEGHYVDDMEYFASKNAAWDLPMSIQGVGPSAGPQQLSHARQMTILGWYERARLARAFAPEALEILRKKRSEAFLRQNGAGRWMVTEATVRPHRVGSSDFRAWQVSVPQDDPSATLRVKALFGAAPYANTNAVVLVGADDLAQLKKKTAAQVTLALSAGASEHGKTLKFVAENRRPDSRAAWTEAGLAYEYPFRDARVKREKSSGGAFGFWVKGDGSGAYLDLQVKSAAIFVGGTSDHIVKIDFTGWRYVQVFVRERDTDEFCNHVWSTQPGLYSHYRQRMGLEHVESVKLCLAEVPAGGRTEIEISPVKVLPILPFTLKEASLTVGGVRHAIPFTMNSGDFAELDAGVWTRYAISGEALEQAPADSPVRLAAGVNNLAFAAACAEGDPRADVQVFARGKSVPALVAKPPEPEHLAYEAVLPMPFDPAKGFAKLPPVRARPGETARLEFTVYGAVTEPSVTIGGRAVVFPVTVAADAKLVIRDGLNWQIVNRSRKVVREGRLDQPLPVLKGGETAVFSAKAGTNARFAVVKRYGAPARSAARAQTGRAATASTVENPWRGCDVRLSPDVKWALGGFGRAMAFDGKKARADVTSAAGAADGWTVTAWVRADAGNRAQSAFALTGEVAQGAKLAPEHWTFVAVRGTGRLPAFQLGTDGLSAFSGIVDDLTVRSGRLTDAQLAEGASDAEHVDIIGYQDDGTGGVAPIRIVPRD